MKQYIITLVIEAPSEPVAIDFAANMVLPTQYELTLMSVRFNTANIREAGQPVCEVWNELREN